MPIESTFGEEEEALHQGTIESTFGEEEEALHQGTIGRLQVALRCPACLTHSPPLSPALSLSIPPCLALCLSQ